MRYFYTDPLAVAWMEKHFGMKFDSMLGKAVNPNDSVWGDFQQTREEINGKKYIHPDSLHLLEPQKGDRLLWRGYGRTEWKYEEACPRTTMKGWEFLILQRNGISFMWPEQES